MAWKGEKGTDADISRLQSVLSGSKLKGEDSAQYQVISQLISAAQIFRDKISNAFIIGISKLDLANEVAGQLQPANGGSYSLYYLPTLTDGANVALSSEFYTMYYRVGKIVTVSGKVEITPTAGGTLTVFEISLPVVSKFASADQCSGIISAEAASGVPTMLAAGTITGNVTLQTAQVRFYSLDTSIHDVRFTFNYELF